MFIPIYKQVISHRHRQDEEVEANASLDLNLHATFRQGLITDGDISITLCTLGFVYHVFDRGDYNQGWELFLPYDMLVVDETSRATYCDW